jgi:hypothetical protein
MCRGAVKHLSEECPTGTRGASHRPDKLWENLLVEDIGGSEGIEEGCISAFLG